MVMPIRDVFRTEAARLSAVLAGLAEADHARPTACVPWSVRDLLAHVSTGAGRIVGMLAAPAPPHAEVDPAAYFGPAKFAPETDADRIDSARRLGAEYVSGRDLAADFDRSWRGAYDATGSVPPDRVVRTRHGDPMTVPDFLVTRVVELGVHGLDLAAALDREPWLTEPAAEVIAELLARSAGTGGDGLTEELGWDRFTLIAKATGRLPRGGSEQRAIDRRDVHWPAFG